ncbi:SLBB domain-containing protein [Rhizobacter sp. AJA081-3]|uniref:polysaccharide biosynthesis/export family protein n=1 Tax=Rhizobacter sp. AJA081-3 TaxID=2753607 RepID=UPI001ADFD1B5|nr:SLBB domain-containing protein [Rhizobacter sp. AJA081-3]QTN23481.1 SLBB domain-containing protein [Rhizobacter sp. AJA081-3]
MISLRLRSAAFFTALIFAGITAVQAAEEASSPQTFITPGYTPPTATRVPGAAGQAAPGAAGTTRGATTAPASRQAETGAERAMDAQAAIDRPAVPVKPSEFQKFVEGATGRLLPVFGADFFADNRRLPSTADNVPVSGDYLVGPGDEVMIRAWGSIDVDYRSKVDRNGQINMPKVGSFNVAGVKAADLEQHLRSQIGRIYTNFSLSVTLGQLRGLRVFVVGPAQRPGAYTLPGQSTVLSAMAAAGGPGAQGSMRRVTLRRDGKVVSELDFYDFVVQGDKSKDLQLQAGDVVVFEPAGARVALAGATDAPAIYELKSAQESVRDLLRYSGGATVLANMSRAQLERIDPAMPKSPRQVEDFALDATGLTKPLRDGDVLTLLAISPKFANAVTLKGHVAQPLRYPYRPGMRIRDLIPDREALVSPDFYRRKNLLVQVIEEDDANGQAEGEVMQPAATNGVAPAPGQVQQTGKRLRTREQSEDRAVAQRARRTPAALFDELNWDYAVVERLSEVDLSTQVIPFNLGKAVLQGDEASNIELRAGDVVTIYSQKDVRVPVARQTRLVSVEGEVGAPGVYQLLPGETLRGLIQRAGGFTPQAYVYGLEFSREETRQRQRENLNEAIARLESLSATQAAREAANRRDDPNASVVSAAATQAQLSRLARLQPNGRIALELNPNDKTLEALPDVPLDHGDRISVPPRPGFVTVAGAVVNSNAFLWKPGRKAGDYLKLAGADEAADPSNMFILRADGTVVHAGDRRGFFGGSNLEAQEMQPGDALIVPNQLDFETFGRALVRNLKDWSQIFSQFGLGAAAIKTLNN